MTNEELFDSALNACFKLLNIRYEILIGKKDKTVYLDLPFKKSQFPHLLGIHKLKDVRKLFEHNNKERCFQNIITNKNDIKSIITKSKLFYKITRRLKALIKLEDIIDNNLETYYSKNRYYQRSSLIEYDYVFDYCVKGTYYAFYFIKQNNNSYVMVSLFENYLSQELHKNRPFVLLFKTKVLSKPNLIKIILFKK